MNRVASPNRRARRRAGTFAVIFAIVAASLTLVISPARALADASAVVPNSAFGGFADQSMGPTDDGSSSASEAFGFNINYFGTEDAGAWVNNNGNLTFDGPNGGYTPFGLPGATDAIIAPFFADVDTWQGNQVDFGTGTLNGFKIFVANWPGVECYPANNGAVLDDFQVILIDRPDLGTSASGDDFQIEFNFDSIQWDAGQASNGDGNCTNSPDSDAAAVGYSDGTQTAGHYYQLPGSQVSGGLLDSNTSTGLIFNELNSDTATSEPPSGTPVLGRYIFNVTGGVPVAPTTVDTSLSGGGDSGTSVSVAPNTAVTDSATLSGPNTPTAGGTLTYGVYSDNACTTLISDGGTFAVTNGSVPDSNPVSLPDVGTYYWDAAYSGDALNDPSDAGCSETESVVVPPVSVSTNVNDGTTDTAWNGAEVIGATAYDTASVSSSSGFTPTGTVTYSLFGNGTCSGGASTTEDVTISAGAVPDGSSTGALSAGAYSYSAAYSGDSNNAATTGSCEPFTVAKASASPGSVVDDPALGAAWNGDETTGSTASDTATMSAVASVTPTGTLLYSLFTNATCAGGASTTDTETLSGGAVPDSSTTVPLTEGSYSFKAAYSGDGSYLAGSAPCEPFAVVPVQSGVGTVVDDATTNAAWDGSETLGTSAYDTATVDTVGGITPTGELTYSFFLNGTCSGTASTTDTVTLSGGAVPDSSATDALSAGSYSYSGSYSGDSNYLAATGSCETFVMAKSTSTIGAVVDDAATNTPWAGTETTGASVYDTSTLATVGGIIPTGTVTYSFFNDGSCGVLYARTPVSLSGGSIPNSTTFGPVNAGSYAFDATYSGDGNYRATTSSCEPFTVLEAPAITSADNVTFVITHAGSFTVTTTGYAGGAAMVIDDGSASLPSGVTFVDNGDGTATLSGTPDVGTSGTYPFTITATNGVPTPATQDFTLTIDLAPAITTVNATTFSVGVAGSFTVGSDGFPGAGTMAVSDGGGTLPAGVTFVDNGDESATLSGTPDPGTGGTYTFTITAANGVTPDATQVFTLTVDEAPTVTSADGVTFGVGATSSFTITMEGFPDGASASFADGNASLPTGIFFVDNENGTATLHGTPTNGSIGAYPIPLTVTNGINPAGTQAFTLTVAAAGTTTELLSPTNPSAVGQSVTLIASISVVAPSTGAPTGTASFDDGGSTIAACGSQPVSSGIASCITSFPDAGAHTLSATYSGDGNFVPSTSAPFAQTVNAASTTITTSSSANPAVTGQSVTYTVTVSRTAPAAGSAEGTVSFTDSGTLIPGCEAVGVSSSVATCTVPFAEPGSHSIVAAYSGDADDLTSTGSPLVETVGLDSTVTTVASSPDPSAVGAKVTITVTVKAALPGAGNPTGSVAIFVDGLQVATVGLDSTVDSRATFGVANLTLGVHAITAIYNGDATYAGSVSAASADSQDVVLTVAVPVTGGAQGGWAPIAALALIMNGVILVACTRRRRRL